jgi:elongation factor Ts
MAIAIALVKELRERTGLGMMDCKKALKASGGDIEQAIDDLRKASGMKAAKKAGRTAAEGAVVTRISEDGTFGLVLEVNCETDFVGRDESFLDFVGAVADAAFAAKTSDVAAVMAGALEDRREKLVQKIGENISVRRIEIAEGAVVSAYVHGGKIAVLTVMTAGDQALGKDIAMHVAAVNPQVVSADDVSEDVLAREKEIVVAQSEGSGKPAAIIEKMVQGRIKKFLAEISLVEQAFVKNPDVKVGQLAKEAGAEVVSFTRVEVGEGIEVEELDFAAEVAKVGGVA